MPPINETTTSTRDLVPPDFYDDYEAYWAWQNDYEENKEKYIEEEFVQSGPVRLLEAVYCDPCKAKVLNFDEMNLQSIGKAIDHLTLNKKNRREGFFLLRGIGVLKCSKLTIKVGCSNYLFWSCTHTNAVCDV